VRHSAVDQTNVVFAAYLKQITIRLDEPTIEYFKGAADLSGIPYQTLINLYLRDCAQRGRKLSMDWRAAG
jgi:predicted DNA binding CopG/RHH family protein